MTAPSSGWRPYAEVHGADHTVSGKVLVWPRVEGAPPRAVRIGVTDIQAANRA